MSKKYRYRSICHNKCYWKENLWMPGEIYEGEDPPGKHFHSEGEDAPEEEISEPGTDPRPTVKLKQILKDKFNFNVPMSWTHRKTWMKLRDMEISSSKDNLTNPSMKWTAPCGFDAKSNAGLEAHRRQCDKCKQVAA